MEKTTWYGPSTCDFCGRNCQKTLYDGKTKSGTWATMCSHCFTENGVGLGYGVGQKYTLNIETQMYELDTATYYSKDEPNAQGLNFKIDFPTDWECKRSNPLDAACHFEKIEFNDIDLKTANLMITVKKYSKQKMAALKKSNYLLEGLTEELLGHHDYTVTTAQEIKISGQDSWLVESKIDQENLPFSMFGTLLKAEFAYKNYFITILAGATGNSRSNGETMFKEAKPIFLEMINSFTILDE